MIGWVWQKLTHHRDLTAVEFARLIIMGTAGYAAYSAYAIPRVEPPVLATRFDQGWAILLYVGAACCILTGIRWSRALAAVGFGLVVSCLFFRAASFLIADDLPFSRRRSGVGVWAFPAGLVAVVWLHLVLPIQTMARRRG